MLIKKNKGLTLLEIVISMSVLSVMVIAIASFQTSSFQVSEGARDKEFAARKAVTMLEEIISATERAPDLNEALADMVDELNNPILTLHGVTDPLHPMSGNVQMVRSDGQTIFKFSRKIELQRFGGSVNANIKMARVTIFVNHRDGRTTPIVGVGTIIQAPLQVFPPSQVYDVYLLTAESSPSWWVHMSQTRDNFEAQLLDLMSRNPGLTFRSHFITANGYGRNPMYVPYINKALSSVEDPMALGYIYPGTHSYTDNNLNGSNPGMYYFPDIFQARYNSDGTMINDFHGDELLDNPEAGKVYNPFPHAFCDRFNQDMRYPDALDYFNKKSESRKEYINKRRQFIKDRDFELKTFGNSDKNLNDMPELPVEEPSWRILLEQMVTQPEKFHNAIFLNLHGELLPLPAIRNYSDAAKDPEDLPGIRVVTHTEKIWNKINKVLPTSSDDVKLRVYSYLSDVGTFNNTYHKNTAGANNQTENRMPTPITIVLKNVDLTANVNGAPLLRSLRIQRIVGGYPWTRQGADSDYALEDAPVRKAATETQAEEALGSINPDEMYVRYRVLKIDTNADNVPDVFHTVLYLFNSPLGCPLVNNRGLASNRRLYNLEYIPNPVVAPSTTNNFQRDLTNNSSGNFKNTARWVITIPKELIIAGDILRDPNGTLANVVLGQDLSHELRIETRIGDKLGTPSSDPNAQFTAGVGVNTEKTDHSGTMYPVDKRFKPENLSTTYAWWTSDLAKIPFTELFQYMGDPRHSPYADNCTTVTGVTTVGEGYNPYWDDVNNNWGFIDATATKDGWGGDKIEIDLPRYQQLVRRAILNSELLYTTLTGFSYFYVSVGGEIGVDSANGFPKSVQVNNAPFGGNGSGSVFVDEYAGFGGSRIHYLKKEKGATDFPLLFWIGELYHDEDYDRQWGLEITGAVPDSAAMEPNKLIGGNIVARAGNNNYLRVRRNDEVFRAEDSGVSNNSGLLNENCQHRLSTLGCGSMVHILNTDSKTFTHLFSSGNCNIASDGIALSTEYSVPLPSAIKSSRPWDITGGIDNNQFEMSNHSYWRNRFFVMLKGAPIREYYSHNGSSIGSGLLKIQFRNDPAVNLLTTQLDPFIRKDNNGYIAVNGLDRATEEATSTINKLSLLTLLHSFLELGLDYQTRMIPRLSIAKPDVSEALPRNPSTIEVAWRIDYRRWDGKNYTPAYDTNSYPPANDEGFPFRPGNLSQELGDLFFVPMITKDLTLPWLDVIQFQKGETNDSVLLRESGERPNDPTGEFDDYRVDIGTPIQIDQDGLFTFDLDLSDQNKYPTGTYFFRVECFRLNEQQHYSFHQMVIDIKR